MKNPSFFHSFIIVTNLIITTKDHQQKETPWNQYAKNWEKQAMSAGLQSWVGKCAGLFAVDFWVSLSNQSLFV